MFAKASDWGYEESNPCQGVRRFREQQRERFLHADELPRFFQAVADEPNLTIRDFVLLFLLTGARRGNVQAMRWNDLDLDRETWTIPITKSGSSQTVALVRPTIMILRKRRK